jgi:hypothetical protein
MFNMSMGVGEHIVRGVAVYVFLLVLLRFVGKKHIGELAPFDLLVLLILSETVQNSLVGDDTSLIGGLISATTLVVLENPEFSSGMGGDARPKWPNSAYPHQNSRKLYATRVAVTSAQSARRSWKTTVGSPSSKSESSLPKHAANLRRQTMSGMDLDGLTPTENRLTQIEKRLVRIEGKLNFGLSIIIALSVLTLIKLFWPD